MMKKTIIGIIFILISASFFITTVTAIDRDFYLAVDGPTEGQAGVKMYWNLTVYDGTPPYQYGGNWGDDPPGGPGMDWSTFPTYLNPLMVSHTFSEAGEYLVTFTVSDSSDPKNRDTVELPVTIVPPPFSVEIIPPDVNEIWVNEEYQWECEVTGGGELLEFTWFWGDGTEDWTEETNIMHTYTEPTLPDGPPNQYTTVHLEAIWVPEPHQPLYVIAEDDYDIPNGVWGFDLEIRVDKLGAGQIVYPIIPYIFTITTKLIRDQSNVNSDDNWGVIWEWPFGGDILPNYHGSYNGVILYENGVNTHQKTIIRSGPIGGWNPGTYCPFNVELWTSIYEWNPTNNDDHVNLWYLSYP